MKKRVKKSIAKNENLPDAALSRETDREVKRKVKRATKKALTEKTSLDDKENSELTSDLAQAGERELESSAKITSVKRKRSTTKSSVVSRCDRDVIELDDGKRCLKRKSTKSKKKSDNDNNSLSDGDLNNGNLLIGNSQSVQTASQAKKTKRIKRNSAIIDNSANRVSVPKKRGDLSSGERTDDFERETAEESVMSENLARRFADEYELIKTRMERFVFSDAEKKRRCRNQEEKKVVPPEDYGYVGELPFWKPGWLVVQGAREHNLKSIDVPFPLSAFTVVTGVSGSGKSSLVEDVLYRYLARMLNRSQLPCGACDAVLGLERVDKVSKVDQAPIGKTPTSNAATFTGAFDLIRQLFAQTQEAKLRRYSPRHFSFNVPGGRCEKCEGSGMIKVEMHFLADVYITCDACCGKRYDSETLKVKFRGKSIADVLETTCGEALDFFKNIPPIVRILQTLCDVGLDYLPLGQPATTLSGGEAQRIKLAAELSQRDSKRAFYILDEPTTGLHFEDVRKLLVVLHRLVDMGNTVVVVEHNLDVVKNADWVLEIGPEAGLEGGRLVFAGTPEQLLEYAVTWQTTRNAQKTLPRSYTGEALIPVFSKGVFKERPIFEPSVTQKTTVEETTEWTDDSSREFVEQPWEIDGKRWHTEFRTTRGGVPCKWEGRALSAIVEKLEEKSLFAETNWQNRTNVEIVVDDKPNLWFMRAITNEEWLLRLKFRTAKNTFERVALTRKLALKPLKDVEDIPLYGTLPRVKIDVVGAWQEIELKVYSFSEIDRNEFWDFLELAYKQFAALIERPKELDVDLTPWRTQGREWHMSSLGFYGVGKALWSIELLEKVIVVIEEVDSGIEFFWTNKIAVPFLVKNASIQLGKIYTKNSEFLSVQINYPRGEVTPDQIADIGFQPELEHNESGFDSLFLRYRNLEDFEPEKLRSTLKRALEKCERLKSEKK